MSTKILKKDIQIPFPHFTVLKASAGSGKTYALTKRFVQLILSEKIPKNNIKNILAITFTNNSAKEMKERILSWLKSIYLNDIEKISEFSEIVSIDKDRMVEKSGHLLDEILDNYSDFQVKTIDSFMTSIFKASAIDFGYNTDFDILMDIDSIMRYSFDLFLKNVNEKSSNAVLLEDIITLIFENKDKSASYPWDPTQILFQEIKKLYRKISSLGKNPEVYDLYSEMTFIKNQMREKIKNIEKIISKYGFEKNLKSSFESISNMVKEGRFIDLIGKGIKNPPVKKPKEKEYALNKAYKQILMIWNEIGKLIEEYTLLYSKTYFTPYIKFYLELSSIINSIKKQENKIFIEDINWNLSNYIYKNIIPYIYFSLGETIYHFLIDEFQDTSTIQWKNLYPLIENSLSQGGSIFIVGDTKQSIYSFRNADFTIMKELEIRNPFPSATHNIESLETNYRSLEKILEFNEKIFKETVRNNKEYKDAGNRSGLTDYIQKVRNGCTEPGYVEVSIVNKNEEEPLEKIKIIDTIQDLENRGYKYNDIAILTSKNEDVLKITTWLNEKNIKFISYSSLDIRRRKITGEIISLLNFLNSPINDFAFSNFILGDIFLKTLSINNINISTDQIREFCFKYKDKTPLYKFFQYEYQPLWDKYFDELFKLTGYLPIYDLISQIFNIFRIFEIIPNEEATLVKILEVVNELEGAGYNNIADLLYFASSLETSEFNWDMDVPKNTNAVKVMTIHKAKGLGFPVVIIVLYEEYIRGFDYIVHSFKKEKISLLKITNNMTNNQFLKELYEEEKIKNKINRLNSLYVGFTRPHEQLYVIGVKGEKTRYPLNILPVEQYPPTYKPFKTFCPDIIKRNDIPISHFHKNLEFHASLEKLINLDERKRGEFYHRLLSYIEFIDNNFENEIPLIIKRVEEEMGNTFSFEEIKNTIINFITQKDIKKYFEKIPERVIMREQELSDKNGNLFRIDRIIFDKDRITVIEYKTGYDKNYESSYISQIKKYLSILRDIYPETTVEGIIAYIDLLKIRRIN